MIGFYNYTVILTYLSALSASTGIVVALSGAGHPYLGCFFLLFCGLCDAFDGKVKLLVLIGQTREKIAECAEQHGFKDYVFADTFEEAFQICVKNAVSGAAVLLSPACASWGMFPNYEVRGKIFKDMVRALV